MLVLTRNSDEAVMVGNTLVTIQEIRGGKVKLSFDGPEKVLRAELLAVQPAESKAESDESSKA